MIYYLKSPFWAHSAGPYLNEWALEHIKTHQTATTGFRCFAVEAYTKAIYAIRQAHEKSRKHGLRFQFLSWTSSVSGSKCHEHEHINISSPLSIP